MAEDYLYEFTPYFLPDFDSIVILPCMFSTILMCVSVRRVWFMHFKCFRVDKTDSWTWYGSDTEASVQPVWHRHTFSLRFHLFPQVSHLQKFYHLCLQHSFICHNKAFKQSGLLEMGLKSINCDLSAVPIFRTSGPGMFALNTEGKCANF